MNNRKEMKSIQASAWILIVIFSFELLLPNFAYAGGPSQPEVQGFTPIGFDNMVDPFTGDFSYNIPLMDVEGYPLNIAYSAGISMEQEASWVGLGWNLNVGAVTRSLRGIPDDFDGDEIEKTTNMKPNRTYNLDLGVTFELLGKENKNNGQVNMPNLSLGMAVSYNNYNGWASQFSMGVGLSLSKGGEGPLSAGLNFTGSSENGAAFAPSLNYSLALGKNESDNKLGLKLGSAFNSRKGLQYISFSADYSKKYIDTEDNNVTVKSKEASDRNGTSKSSSYNLGLNSYTPTAGSNLKNISLSGTFKLGPDAFGVDLTGKIGIAYSSQWIPKDEQKTFRPSYGYFHLQHGQNNPQAILDFNRDNDGSYTKETPRLPSAALTNDIFSVQAQGISGNFKGFRNDIGYVFDPAIKTTSDDGSLGFELGGGNLFKGGLDIAYNRTTSESGAWDDGNNKLISDIKFRSPSRKQNNFSLIEANESAVENDTYFKNNFYNNKVLSFDLDGTGVLPKVKRPGHMGGGNALRVQDYIQNSMMQFLTNEDVYQGFGVGSYLLTETSGKKMNHIGEIIQLGTDGRRYVFGLPAYNQFQEDVTFSIGASTYEESTLTPSDDYSGLIDYSSKLNAVTVDNDLGIDNYYQSTKTPAYAHSFMLTAVLSDDYVDADDVKGPSVNDLGGYVKFNYQKISNYKWRSPIALNSAYRNENLLTDLRDDKASFVYGEKDIWFVADIQTKNYIAIFHLSKRQDGYAVNDRNGNVSSANNAALKIDSISLYTRPDYELNGVNATAIQRVHFVYNYSLCNGYPLNAHGGGKLTLTKIFFTYQGSRRMAKSAYEFTYGFNPNYNIKAVDRWGNFKQNSGSGINNPLTGILSNAEYPYAEQDKSIADSYAAAWCLTSIKLPSGGLMQVEYEADDYAYVQNKEAMRMFKIVATEDNLTSIILADHNVIDLSNEGAANKTVCFEMLPGYDDIKSYLAGVNDLYFRTLSRFRQNVSSKTSYEYVSGYGLIDTYYVINHQSKKYGVVKFKGEELSDNSSIKYHPIVKAAILFGRINLSSFVSDVVESNLYVHENASDNSALALGQSVVNALGSFGELFKNPNKVVYDKERGTDIVTNKSWIRLKDPTKAKIGGGHRVKRIKMYDNWSLMSGGNDFFYGQEYKYTLEDGKTSSGVATYEPQLGGDENPFRLPTRYKEKLRMSPDRDLFVDEPIMESHFPSPTVGYSRVEIQNLKRANVTKTATGKVVKEFYTAKDFPTITEATGMQAKPYNNYIPLTPKVQKVAVAQGFVIELNDMHGKPKKEMIYGENQVSPNSAVEYHYKRDGARLHNEVMAINPDGSVGLKEIGVRREAVADFRKSITNFTGVTAQVNLNVFLAGIFPFGVPTIWPGFEKSTTQFRSATVSKIINRFGILEKTVATQDGSTVETNNVAYEANTGQVLITQTTTNFNDSIYSTSFPAYWKYDQLGQAYKNQGLILFNKSIVGGNLQYPNANKDFVEGDELMIKDWDLNNPPIYTKGWVNKVTNNGIEIIDKAGNLIDANVAKIQVIRSGRRNKQMEAMASITQLTNPLYKIKSNNYTQVLNAGAIDFSQFWKADCECFQSGNELATTNPFILGTKGNFRPVRSFTHLTERTQTNNTGNTNIRKDGVFKSYTPYYKLQNGKWTVDGKNWTYVSEVTEFSPNGMTLETKDALGRYSTSQFGFNNTLNTAVAANTSIKQLLNLHFEDEEYGNCANNKVEIANLTLDKTTAHTGRNSIKVSAGNPVTMASNDQSCPSQECNITLIDSKDGFDLQNVTAPILMDVQVISGDVDLTLMPENTIFAVYGSADDYLEYILTIQDANGCQLVKTIKISK